MTTQQQLQAVFRDNFVAYYRAHVAHVNIQGRNFYSDHRLLGRIYQDLQGQIDVWGEVIRTQGDFVPDSLHAVLVDSGLDDGPITGTDLDLLSAVRADLTQLADSFRELSEAASEDQLEDIENLAQERILALNRWLWQLDSTLTPQQ